MSVFGYVSMAISSILIKKPIDPPGRVVEDHVQEDKKEILRLVAYYVHYAAINYWVLLYTN